MCHQSDTRPPHRVGKVKVVLMATHRRTCTPAPYGSEPS